MEKGTNQKEWLQTAFVVFFRRWCVCSPDGFLVVFCDGDVSVVV